MRALGLVFALLLVGCAEHTAFDPITPSALDPSGSIERPDPTRLASLQVLHRGNNTNPEGLDPHRTEGVATSHIQRDLFEGLTTEAPDGSIVPGAAKSWTISADGLNYTFRLRPDARWSNGDPVTADDWVFSLRRSVDPATGSRYSLILAPIRHAEDVIARRLPPESLAVRATDPLTLEIELKAATPYFLGLLAHNAAYPVHPPSAIAQGDAHGRAETLVSNGPYKASELVVGSHTKLVRNPYFHDAENVHIEAVYFYPIENLSAELSRYRADQLDWTYELPSAQLGWLKRQLGDELRVAPYLGIYYFGFNTTRPPLDDLRVRRALAMAIERDLITERLMGMRGTATYGFVPPGIPGYRPQRPEWAAWSQAERDDEARRLLAEAGYGPDNPLEVEIRYNTHEDHKRLSLAISWMWRSKLGVRTRLLNEEFRVFLANRRQRMVTQVYRAGWIGDYLDPYTFLEINRSESAQNDAGWSNARYDALLARAAREPDAEARFRLLEEAEALMLDEAPHATIYGYTSKRLVKPWVKGWQPNPLDHHPTRWMWIESHERRP
ncbi:MAG TPA: peptide ABC transporter substrate-binding protein [Xanthomonadaceae bacterium]|nr:peptide ABC transporter substrate-binding protein [Xanthomonadaceae bacterium]